MATKTKGVVLVIMDGWGLAPASKTNGVSVGKTPHYDKYMKEYPHARLKADGESVGLPVGQMGTSEVNHLTIGAGRVIYQDLVKINKEIETEAIFENEVLVEALEKAKANKVKLHLIGLLSDGGVHSHIDHFKALLQMSKKHDLNKVFVHAFTDGRDTLATSGKKYIAELEREMKALNTGKLATLVGRYFAMDRDHNWERTDKAYDLLVSNNGKEFSSAKAAIEESYELGITDEFVEPAVINSAGDSKIEEGDVVIFVNFRIDRPRQLTERFIQKGPETHFVTMTRYNPLYAVKVAYPPTELSNSLGEFLSEAGIKQLRVTETEKFAHLTFFLNCKREEAYEGEDRIMFDSYSDIPTHDHRPEMRAADVAGQVVEAIEKGTHQVIFTNICNPDMVGHTGNFPAIVKAVEATDDAIGKIVSAAKKHHYDVIITADHGNAEETVDEKTGEPKTSHSLNPVPCIFVSESYKKLNKKDGTLIDLAPTIIEMLGLKTPPEMEGESLV